MPLKLPNSRSQNSLSRLRNTGTKRPTPKTSLKNTSPAGTILLSLALPLKVNRDTMSLKEGAGIVLIEFLVCLFLIVLFEALGIKPAPNRSKEGYSNRASQIRARRQLKRIGRWKW